MSDTIDRLVTRMDADEDVPSTPLATKPSQQKIEIELGEYPWLSTIKIDGQQIDVYSLKVDLTSDRTRVWIEPVLGEGTRIILNGVLLTPGESQHEALLQRAAAYFASPGPKYADFLTPEQEACRRLVESKIREWVDMGLISLGSIR